MNAPFAPHLAEVARTPRSWKYELKETLELSLVSPDHKLFIPGGHAQLISAHRSFVMADIHVDRLIVHEGLYYDGSTWAFDWGVMQRGAAFHDVLCDAADRGEIPAENQPIADLIMRDVWLSDAACVRPWLRRAYVPYVHARYAAVRTFQRAQHGF